MDSRKQSVENYFSLRELSTKDGLIFISKEKSYLNEKFGNFRANIVEYSNSLVQKVIGLEFMDQLLNELFLNYMYMTFLCRFGSFNGGLAIPILIF